MSALTEKYFALLETAKLAEKDGTPAADLRDVGVALIELGNKLLEECPRCRYEAPFGGPECPREQIAGVPVGGGA